MKKKLLLVIVILVALIPLIYLGVVYNTMPTIVATHFGLNGKPNGYSSKSTLVWIVAFLAALTILMYLLLTNLYRIDPKRYSQFSTVVMKKIAWGIVVLLTSISAIIIYSSVHNLFSFQKVLLPLMGLFFAYIGNLLHSVKPNYFVGIRTPWALENEDNWRKTHQLAGKLWFVGGVIIAIFALLLRAEYSIIVTLTVLIVITLMPVIFSYRYFQLHKNLSK